MIQTNTDVLIDDNSSLSERVCDILNSISVGKKAILSDL